MSEQTHSDPVAVKLQASGDNQRANLLQWLDAQQQRNAMRRRASVCTFGGWFLLLAAAAISTAASIYLSMQIRELMEGTEVSEVFLTEFGETSRPILGTNYLPHILATLTSVLFVGGVLAWWFQRVPGFSRTVSAIDWSSASDAVTRLVQIGCTFPDAFRTAGEITVLKRNRDWFLTAARRVESGGPELTEHSVATGDVGLVETLVSAVDGTPDRRWKLAADHLYNVAQRRLAVLLQTFPMIATILSGLIIWLAITATLGWMWQAIAALLRDFGGGFVP